MGTILKINQVSPASNIFLDVVGIPGIEEPEALWMAYPREMDVKDAKEAFRQRFGYLPIFNSKDQEHIFCGPVRRRKRSRRQCSKPAGNPEVQNVP